MLKDLLSLLMSVLVALGPAASAPARTSEPPAPPVSAQTAAPVAAVLDAAPVTQPEKTPAPTAVPAAHTPAPTPTQAPVIAYPETLEGIDDSTVIDCGPYCLYDFDRHSAVGVGLDGSQLGCEAYYGFSVDTTGSKVVYTPYNYTADAITVTGASLYGVAAQTPYTISTPTMGSAKALDFSTLPNGAYELTVEFSSGVTVMQVLYQNGGEVYAPQVSKYALYGVQRWVQGCRNIDQLMAEQGVTPENSLGVSDTDWAYPVPQRGSKYRCDNQRWIDLAHQLVPDESLPNMAKAVLLHDWMTAHLAYDNYKVSKLGMTRMKYAKDYSGTWHMWDTHAGVCADFTTVFAIMCRAVGVPCTSVDYKDTHVWNLVWTGHDWVQVDLTLDVGRSVSGEDVTQVEHADRTVSYKAFARAWADYARPKDKLSIGQGIYTYDFVTKKAK